MNLYNARRKALKKLLLSLIIYDIYRCRRGFMNGGQREEGSWGAQEDECE